MTSRFKLKMGEKSPKTIVFKVKKLSQLEFSDIYTVNSHPLISSLFLFNTKVRKERGNSCWKIEEILRWKAHINTWQLHWNISTDTDLFFNQNRLNVCEASMCLCAPFVWRSLLLFYFFFFVRVCSFFSYFCVIHTLILSIPSVQII